MNVDIEKLENTDTTVENEERIEQGINLDELADMLGEGVMLDTDNLYDAILDSKAFNKGVKSISELCGKFVALRSVGMSEESASTLLINRETAEHNLELGRIQENQAKVSQELNSI